MASIDKQLVHFSHMAPAIYEHQNHDGFALFGHSHGNYKDAVPNNNGGGKRLDVSVDVALKYNKNCFFDWNEIVRIMRGKEVQILDHHGE